MRDLFVFTTMLQRPPARLGSLARSEDVDAVPEAGQEATLGVRLCRPMSAAEQHRGPLSPAHAHPSGSTAGGPFHASPCEIEGTAMRPTRGACTLFQKGACPQVSAAAAKIRGHPHR